MLNSMLPIYESYRRLRENNNEATIKQAMQQIMQFVTNPDTPHDELELNDTLAMNIANGIYDGSTDEYGYGWDGEIDMEIFAEALSRLFRLGKLTFDVSETGTNLYIRQT